MPYRFRGAHLGLGVDMLSGVAGSELQHTHTWRGVDIGPQLADTQAVLVHMKTRQGACTAWSNCISACLADESRRWSAARGREAWGEGVNRGGIGIMQSAPDLLVPKP